MKFGLLLLTLSFFTSTTMDKIYTFSAQSDLTEWRIVNDGVMGGVSTSSISLTQAGHGQFSGQVSLANNGGFASVQLNKTIAITEGKKWVVLHLKGDGKRYEFRLKSDTSQKESYVQPFVTSGKWETIKLPITAFNPQFRGRLLNLPSFNFNRIEQFSFFIANKQAQDFTLLIDWIGLE